MRIELSAHREQLVRSLVEAGKFSSEDEVIGEALRLLQLREDAQGARVLGGIARGIEDMEAGRGRPAEEVLEEIRREFDFADEA